MELSNKIILITGGATGIGKETALAFARQHASLVLTYYSDESQGKEAEQLCKEQGASNVALFHLDITDNKSTLHLVEKTLKKHGSIALLINNAGTIEWKHLSEQSFEEIERQVRTNLEGLIKLTKACLPHITDMIINIASTAGIHAHRDLTTYCAAKWGVRGFTKALAQELNIPVYAVNPGATATAMTGFEGIPPAKVAEIIVNLAKGKYNVRSGDDITIPDYLDK